MKEPIFHPGQKVACVDQNFNLLHGQQLFNPHHPAVSTPKEGPIYTVQQVFIFPHAVSITLVEIVNPPMAPDVPEASWNQERFTAVPEVDSLALAEALEETTLQPA